MRASSWACPHRHHCCIRCGSTTAPILVYVGKQEHRGLCWGDVTLKRDSDGREYLELRERQTKTRTGEDIRNVREVAPRAWENGENPERCPVAAYKLFRSKRPKKYCGAEDPFYIAPVPTNPFPSSSERWFISQPVGVNKLCSIMSNMCRAAGVSEDKRLTNHSARKFLVQTLRGARIADRDIMQVTGHKNVQSIRNYIVKSPKKTTGALVICCVATVANHLQLQTFQWQAQAVLVLKDPQTQLPNSPNFKPNSPNFKPNGPNFKPNSPNFQPYSPNFQPNSPNFVINSLGRMWCRQSTQQHIQQLGKCSPIAKLERWSLTIISPPPRPEPEWAHLENGPGASSSPILTVVRIVSDITKSYQNFTYVNMFVGSALRSWILEF